MYLKLVQVSQWVNLIAPKSLSPIIIPPWVENKWASRYKSLNHRSKFIYLEIRGREMLPTTKTHKQTGGVAWDLGAAPAALQLTKPFAHQERAEVANCVSFLSVRLAGNLAIGRRRPSWGARWTLCTSPPHTRVANLRAGVRPRRAPCCPPCSPIPAPSRPRPPSSQSRRRKINRSCVPISRTRWCKFCFSTFRHRHFRN